MKRAILLLSAALMLSGCYRRTIGTENTNNPEIAVHFLFEYNGIRLYRFNDGRNTVYFSDARGMVEYDTGGKNSVRIQSETVR